MNDLAQAIKSAEQELISLKASQPLGESNYGVYVNKTSISHTPSSQAKYYFVIFEGSTDLPLAQFNFRVLENTREVVPRNYYFTLPGANSQLYYSCIYSWGQYVAGGTGGLVVPNEVHYTPSQVVILLQVSGTGVSSSQIEITCKSSCLGALLIAQGTWRN